MFAFLRCLGCGLMLLGVMALVGCETFERGRGRDRVPVENATGLPATAELVQQGRGELSYRAESNGMVYLYSTNLGAVLDRQRMRRGQRYTIEPNRNVATLEGKTVLKREIDPKHMHRLYFDRAGR